jgi:uncharacterized protein
VGSDIGAIVNIVCGVAIIVGIFGTVIPHVPGLILSWAAVVLWAFLTPSGSNKWITVGIVTVVALGATVMKYVLPARRLHQEGVPTVSLLAGVVLAIVGFFVIPIIGLFIGFVVGVFLAELLRLASARLAWPSAWNSIKAVGLSMMIEIFLGMVIFAVWLGSVFLL